MHEVPVSELLVLRIILSSYSQFVARYAVRGHVVAPSASDHPAVRLHHGFELRGRARHHDHRGNVLLLATQPIRVLDVRGHYRVNRR